MKKQLICVNLALWLFALASACNWAQFDNSCNARACGNGGTPYGTETFISACYKKSSTECCECQFKTRYCTVGAPQMVIVTKDMFLEDCMPGSGAAGGVGTNRHCSATPGGGN
jgi:hypothetical protein